MHNLMLTLEGDTQMTKHITKREVSNMVFGADMAYGRIIEFQTEHDTQGTDESLKGVLSPKLDWVKQWKDLPDGLKKYEEERAAKVMGINVRLGMEAVNAIKADLEDKRNEIIENANYEGLNDEELSEQLAEFNALNKGIFADFEVDPGEPIHPNWITFVQGEEEEEVGEEKPEREDRVKAKLEKRNWLHLKSFEGNRKEMVEWFHSKQDAIIASVVGCSILKERALKRAVRLNELIDRKRDESFDQRLLDTIEPPPRHLNEYEKFEDKEFNISGFRVVGNTYPQFRKREHYLNAGGRKGKDPIVTKMLEETDNVRRMSTRTPEQREEKRVAYEKLFEKHSSNKWFQLYMVFVESRKLGTEQYLSLKRRNDALIEAIEGRLSYIPSAPEKVVGGTFTQEDADKTERAATLATHVRLLMKLEQMRELYKDAKDACDDDMRMYAYERGLRTKKLVAQHATDIELTNDEIKLIEKVMEG